MECYYSSHTIMKSPLSMCLIQQKTILESLILKITGLETFPLLCYNPTAFITSVPLQQMWRRSTGKPVTGKESQHYKADYCCKPKQFYSTNVIGNSAIKIR
jgi:hypothetical protein